MSRGRRADDTEEEHCESLAPKGSTRLEICPHMPGYITRVTSRCYITAQVCYITFLFYNIQSSLDVTPLRQDSLQGWEPHPQVAQVYNHDT